MNGHLVTNERWIKLNVGGENFLTTRSTLLKDNSSFLARLVTEDTDLVSDKDENGAYLIDRDPKYFRVVLNYMRHGKLVIDQNLNVDGVIEEAEFYGITGLINLAKKRVEERDRTGSGCPMCGKARKPVYRIFQCSEEELASMVSAISDGWKFEQLISTGSGYNYGSADENGAEFLCIVSKDCSQRHVNTVGDNDTKSHILADGANSDRGSLLLQRGFRS